ncbi:hypothetical protein M413DRAFT_443667 [Hebeloma cylindrosporum]|uniref:mRNA export factor GLE1 n=1 Tax=Hebeloma cylindrosporum TaxID=76867 RepID=A0A0C3CJ68_HEBCY|nr:hypothetical protein M413DRAFT_443667 [Hebeloma cylindrosporum h7]
MRFSAPRSVSPSPVRGRPRNSSTFGLQSDSDSEEYESELESSFDDSDDDAVSIASSTSSNSSSFLLVSDINKLSLRPRHITRTSLEERQIEDTIAAIRLRTRHYDPYEEWEKETRKDSFKTARKDFSTAQSQLHDAHERLRRADEEKRAAAHTAELAEVKTVLDRMRQHQQEVEKKLMDALKHREKQLWNWIEAAIKLEEDKATKRLEEERKVREEEERKRKEAELKRRLAEEKRIQEEAAKKKAEEEKKRQEEEAERQEKEAEERRQKLEKERREQEKELGELRELLNFAPPDEDWRVARTDLLNVKSNPLKFVKSNKQLKATWGTIRRQIVPKIGQLTNDPAAISRISRQLIEIIRPAQGPQHEPAIYFAACSSLAKAILLQAETEVTAEKRSAAPLAQVAFTLLDTLEHFPSIFCAKLLQRCGGWLIPIVVPGKDVDGRPWTDKDERIKVSGIRKSTSGEGLETTEEYSNRVSAIMRVYFHILKIRPTEKPLHPMFQLPRFWTWFARMTSDTRLLQDPVAPQLIYTGLDVLGLEAMDIWGQQWIKMLALIHEGVTTGYDNGNVIGGLTTEGAAARTRVLVALENIMNGVQSS